MKEFNWEEFKNEKVAVHCKTEEEAKDFIEVAYENDCKWNNRDKSFTNFDIYGCKTTYTCGNYNKDQLEWCYYNYFKENNYKILEWSDFMNTNKGGNFKIRVVENIGKYSIESFGSIGTVFKVQNGVFKDKDGLTWINGGKLYKSVEDINNQINKEDCLFRTRFELVKEQQDEYNLTIQDIMKDENEGNKYKSDSYTIDFIATGGKLITTDEKKYNIVDLFPIKQILNMKFKKLEPKQTKKYIDTMKAVQMISENKIVWCEYKDNFLKFNNPKSSKIRIDVLLKGKFYLLINEDEMED